MEDEVLDAFMNIENELASLYKKIKNASHLEPVKEVLNYLIEETLFHSKRIEGMKKKFEKPQLQTSMVYVLYDRLKDSLYSALLKEHDFNKSIDIMAQTEDSIKKIYTATAAHYKKLSEYYEKVSNEFSQLVTEESEHTDILIKKKIGL